MKRWSLLAGEIFPEEKFNTPTDLYHHVTGRVAGFDETVVVEPDGRVTADRSIQDEYVDWWLSEHDPDESMEVIESILARSKEATAARRYTNTYNAYMADQTNNNKNVLTELLAQTVFVQLLNDREK